MAKCLIALGSNLGDRAAMLAAALADLDALPGTRLVSHSGHYAFHSLGGPPGQPHFLNAAALVETNLAPLALFEQLVQIETSHGRRRTERWAARTLDIDLLLYEDQVVETPSLVVPHPRMSFRHFVLRPALEVARDMIHPIIGASIGQLAWQIEFARDWAPIVSPSCADRRELSELVATRFGAKIIEAPISYPPRFANPWPSAVTTWLAVPRAPESSLSFAPDALRPHPLPNLPKLTILVDAPPSAESVASAIDWPTLRQQRGRGPTLWIRTADRAEAACELSAAIESVWTHLGRHGDTRVE
jgi:2-amino-4-hydroxy-6-hydroxymethyldihydropteridine diphosphokinase